MFSHAHIISSWWLRVSQDLGRKEKKLPHVGFSSASPLPFPLAVPKLTQHEQLLQRYHMPSDTEESSCILALRVIRLPENLILPYNKKEK